MANTKLDELTVQEQAALIGRRVVCSRLGMAATVTVLDVRQAFGRTDLRVRDCSGKEQWVSAAGCRVAAEREDAR